MERYLNIRPMLDSAALPPEDIRRAEECVAAMHAMAPQLDLLRLRFDHAMEEALEAWSAGRERCPRRKFLTLRSLWEQAQAKYHTVNERATKEAPDVH